MTKPTGFEDAYDSLTDVVARAAVLPDHRERPVVTPTVTCESDRGEVRVTVHDGKVQSMWLREDWVAETEADDVADLITQVTNKAIDEWGEKHLEELERLTPDMKELHAAISATRAKLEDAWVATLAKAKI